MMIDIKERLRDAALEAINHEYQLFSDVCKEAADHIEQQDAEIARLRKDADNACKPIIPEKRAIDWMENRGDFFSEGWNAAIDKVIALNTSTQEVG